MLWRAYKTVEGRLAGWPDTLLTLVLILAAIATLIIAARGSRVLKAAVAVYVLLP